jgi:phosphatidylglycerol lysyltransferase
MDSPSQSRARELVLRFGWNAVSYQILNRGISLWFSSTHEAVIGYVLRDKVRVVAGAPICDEKDLCAVVREWENEASSVGHKVCYFGAAGRLYELLNRENDYSTVVLGAQPVWHPKDWAQEFSVNKSLRAQLSRAKNKGVRIEEWNPVRARGNRELARILSEWLKSRGLPSLHFLVEPQTLERLGDRRLFVALKNKTPVGFVVLAPIPCRNGYLTEQFVRGREAPNGTIELLLHHAIGTIEAEGASYVTMGLVPLSKLGGAEENPLWLRTLLSWMRSHGQRFYNFGGLETFKAKFNPSLWEPIYAISNESNFSAPMLYAVAGAFTKRPVWVAIVVGLRRAARREVREHGVLSKKTKPTGLR